MLRHYQQSGVEELRAEYAAGSVAPLYVLPTGGGKTFVFCFIAGQITARKKRVLILVHRQELLNQSSRSLRGMGIRHGLIAPGYPEDREPVQIASVQALRARLKKLTPEEVARKYNFDLVVIDEAHHGVAGSWLYIIRAVGAKLLGVTATPCRGDNKGLGVAAGGIFDTMVIGPTINWLMENGYLVRAKVFAPPSGVSMATIRADLKAQKKRGDPSVKDVADAVSKSTITGCAVTHYARLCPHQPALVFCVSIDEAEKAAAKFREAGFKAKALSGEASDSERKEAVGGLADGSLDVLCSCAVISEGTDIPVASVAILENPTDSVGLYMQQVGRVLRPVYAPGFDLDTKEGRLAAIAASSKPWAYVLDHVGNCLNHGMPDEDREWTLDGLVKRSKKSDLPEMKLKQCSQCYAYHEAAPTCPECGYEYPVGGRGELEQVAGELRELTKEEMEAIRARARVTQGQAKTLDELIAIGSARGYKNPRFWAQHVLKGRKY